MEVFQISVNSELSFDYEQKSDGWYSLIVQGQFREEVAYEGYPVG